MQGTWHKWPQHDKGLLLRETDSAKSRARSKFQTGLEKPLFPKHGPNAPEAPTENSGFSVPCALYKCFDSFTMQFCNCGREHHLTSLSFWSNAFLCFPYPKCPLKCPISSLLNNLYKAKIPSTYQIQIKTAKKMYRKKTTSWYVVSKMHSKTFPNVT